MNNMKQLQELKRSKKQHPRHVRGTARPKQRTRSVERLGQASYRQLLDAFCLSARPTQRARSIERLGRATIRLHLSDSARAKYLPRPFALLH